MAYNGNVRTQQNVPAQSNTATLEAWINSVSIKKKFNDVLDKGTGAFVTSLLGLVKQTPQLAACDPKTTLSAAMKAASLKLPIDPNLGFAYLVPYKDKSRGMEATFQMGWRGYVQLAMRTGQYKTINASVVHEGEIEDIDFITGEIVRGKRKGDTVVGYIAYFKLVNGFEKTLYMSREEVEAHASQYSQAYGADKRYGKSRSVWTTNFDAMALKTVLKRLISKYGIMSIDMQGDAMATAIKSDNAVIRDDGTVDYVDGKEEKNITPEPFPEDDTQEDDAQAQPTAEPSEQKTENQPAPAMEESDAPQLDFDLGEPTF